MEKENKFDKNFEIRFNKAVSLKNENKLLEALEIFKQLEAENENYYMIFTLIGDIYWELGKLSEAEIYFKRAVNLNIDSEKVSIAYFNVLWEQDKKHEALEEMKRFLTNNESESYQNILNEINDQE